MRNLFSSLALLSLLGVAAATTDRVTLRQQREVAKNKFGHLETVEYGEDGAFHKTVIMNQKHFSQDYERQTRAMRDHMTQVEINKAKIKNNTIYGCDNRGNFGKDDGGFFFPIQAAVIGPENPVQTFTGGRCFKNITFTYGQTGADKVDIGDVQITVDTEGSDSLFCSDWFFFGTAALQHVDTFYLSGKHSIDFTNLNADAKADVADNGIRIYMFCDGYVDTFISAYNFFLSFLGGFGTDPNTPIYGSHVPEYMVQANLAWLNHSMEMILEERPIQEYAYDESLINSGDFFSILRLDGLDPLIMYGSGSHVGHSVMALRMDGELYIVESQGAWYWPNAGLQKTPFKQWIEWARNADFNVVHMPLSPASRAQFNETAAIEFFQATEGLPYGYHNFLFGWVDTPEENLPPIMPPMLVPIVMSIFEDFDPETADIFFAQPLNHRLGTKGLNVKQVAGEAARRNMTIDDLMAIVEVEGWEYYGMTPRDGRSYVCSAYVAALYQAGGLLKNVNGPEFTPKDIYTLDVFDKNFERPAACVEADPNQPFCQILGRFRLTFPDYSTIKPYEHMAEHCPTAAPEYFRPQGC